MNLRHCLFAVAVILLPHFVEVARACECLQSRPLCAEYWRAEAVFVGTVEAVSPAYNAHGHRSANRTVRFSLERAYRGVEGREAELVNTISSCEYEFEKGKKYFVYAYGNPENNTIGTSGCSRTREVSYAQEDIAYAGGVSEGKPEQSISGVVLENGYTPVKQVKVSVRGEGRRYNVTTDSEGRFKVLISQPGRYEVLFTLPRYSAIVGMAEQLKPFTTYRATDKHTILGGEVDVQAGRCAFFDVPLIIVREKP